MEYCNSFEKKTALEVLVFFVISLKVLKKLYAKLVQPPGFSFLVNIQTQHWYCSTILLITELYIIVPCCNFTTYQAGISLFFCRHKIVTY